MPVTAIVSIGHRLTGIFLALATPLLVYAFETSLSSSAGFDRLISLSQSVPGRIVAVVLFWSLAQHLFSGIRYLGIDLGFWVSRTQARMSAWVATALAAAFAVFGALAL